MGETVTQVIAHYPNANCEDRTLFVSVANCRVFHQQNLQRKVRDIVHCSQIRPGCTFAAHKVFERHFTKASCGYFLCVCRGFYSERVRRLHS